MGTGREMLAIHCEPAIAWQDPFAQKMQFGLNALGIKSRMTPSRIRETDTAILLGTTFWRGIEADGDYLLVDRCSFGDTNQWVSLVWNGHGRRGDHKVPKDKQKRVHDLGLFVGSWRDGKKTILCGQHEAYSPHYDSLPQWYKTIKATHFRPHPQGDNPTGLPLARNFDDCGLVITLNSSIAVDSVMMGIPTVTMDEASMAWDATSHNPTMRYFTERKQWLAWLAWTQWTHDEISAGYPIKHLFEEL